MTSAEAPVAGLAARSVPAAVALARELLESGQAEEARQVWTALRDHHPASPAGWVGLAHLASRQQRWAEAMACWNAALERFPERTHPIWRVGLGRAMYRLGMHDDATQCLRQALELHPEDMAVRQMLIQVLDRTGQLGEALERLEQRRDACLAQAPLQFHYLKLLTRRGRTGDAAVAADALLRSAGSIDELPGIVRMLPELGGKACVIRLAHLATQRLDELQQTPSPRQALAHELQLRLALLRGDLAGFRQWLDRLRPEDLPAGQHEAYRLHADRLALSVRDALQAPKVFGIGLSKTASSSLSQALSLLGLRSAHYQNPLTFEVLDLDHALHFDACNDTPVTHCFETLFFSFPNARFVYTTRPLSHWQASLRAHHQHHFGTDRWDELRALTARCAPPIAAVEASLYFNHADAEAAWRAHDSRVRRFFADKPAGRFLEFDVFAGDGWPQLCAFLGLPEPAVAFPHENAVR